MRFFRLTFLIVFLYFNFVCATKNCCDHGQIVGTHVIAEFSGCSVPEDQESLEKIMRDAAKASGSTDLEFTMHKFQPQGVTAALILSESHITVHSWPETGYAAVDAFTCGTHTDPAKAVESLRKAFKASNVKITVVKRGVATATVATQ